MVIDFSTKLFRVYFSKLGEEAFSGKLGKILMQINKTEKRNCDLVPSRQKFNYFNEIVQGEATDCV